ncbi:MAG: type II toxin-antitoxin system RelE/ParE family toxin [Hormoscilla sp. GUM202]|nr:type II toxin-antitoxin system RelE/ParE family toxin [Hormoscilla sp. GUM202]
MANELQYFHFAVCSEAIELPTLAYARVRDAIFALAEDPRPPGCLKLTNREGWRIRVGDYRVIYEIDDTENIVTILDVDRRRDVYRRSPCVPDRAQ